LADVEWLISDATDRVINEKLAKIWRTYREVKR
jgi:hypothetical protein